MTKIYLDAGHGGYDSGAVGNGLNEKDINLKVANLVQAKLSEYNNVEIMQTRTTDVFLSLTERTVKANNWGADCFVSFHCNANVNPSAKGFETYIYNGSVSSKTIAFQNVLHQEIVNKIGNQVTDRGKQRANFHVLRESNMVALLGENLFVSNSTDANLLKDNSFIDRLAQGYVVGLEKFFGLERTIRPPTESDGDTGELYQVIAGTFSSYENAQTQVKKLSEDGYKSYIQKKE